MIQPPSFIDFLLSPAGLLLAHSAVLLIVLLDFWALRWACKKLAEDGGKARAKQ